MDLEKLNKEYQGAQKDKMYASLDVMEKQLEKLERDLILQKRQGEYAQIKKVHATEDKDEARIKQAEQEIKDAKEAMEKTREQIEKQKETITKTKGKVEKYINEIARDPETKAQIDKMIAGRCKKEVKQIEEGKQQVENFQELLKKHPNVENNVLAMIRAIDEGWRVLQKLNKVTDKINSGTIQDPDEIKRLHEEREDLIKKAAEVDKRIKKYKSMILKCAEKSNIDVSEKWIEEFFRNGSATIAHNKDTKDKDGKIIKGKLNINKTLKNKIKSYDKQLKPYKTTLRNLGVQEGTRGEGESERQGQNGQGTNLPATTGKPKWSWRHPIISFNAWRAWKKQQKQYVDLGHIDENRENAGQQGSQQPTEPEELTPEQLEQRAREKAERRQKNKEFQKSLHYDVVRDYMTKRIQDLQKEDFIEEQPAPQNNENEQQNENAEQNSDEAR